MVAVSIQFTPDQIADAVAQLPDADAERLLCKIAARRGGGSTSSEREGELLRRIALEPQARDVALFEKLRARSKVDDLSASDMSRLESLVERLEHHAAGRLQAIIELAGLRGQTVDELTASLGLRPSHA